MSMPRQVGRRVTGEVLHVGGLAADVAVAHATAAHPLPPDRAYPSVGVALLNSRTVA